MNTVMSNSSELIYSQQILQYDVAKEQLDFLKGSFFLSLVVTIFFLYPCKLSTQQVSIFYSF